MRLRLLSYWERLRSSYWFVPSVMALLAAVLSFVMIWIDTTVSSDWIRGLRWVYRNQPDGARELLSIVAGSMITVAGVTFSVTMVALSLASQQFGPRLLYNFMRDRGNQLVLGTFVATFVYCLLVLRTVRSGEVEFVPQLATTLAVMLAAASVGVFIYFIHHTAESINVATIIARVSHNMNAAIQDSYPERQLFPASLGKELGEVGAEPPAGAALEGKVETDVPTAQGGYLQTLDIDGLLHLAKKFDLVVELKHRPGSFLVSGGHLLSVWSEAGADEALRAALNEKFAFGSHRSQSQDLDFLFDQLTEIAVRALSPAVNDPYTAMMCLDRIGDGLSLLGRRRLPASHRYDEEGRLRVVVPPFDLAELVDNTLGSVRRYAGSSFLLYLHLLGTIDAVLAMTPAPRLREALREQVDLIERGGCAQLLEADCRKLAAASRATLERLRDAPRDEVAEAVD